MRKSSLILLCMLLFNSLFSQKDYRESRYVNSTHTYHSDFIIYPDSICYLKQRYQDNSSYALYKGTLSRANDTLYQFHYRPVVDFGCSMRIGTDSVYVDFEQHDTILQNPVFRIRTVNGAYQTFDPGIEGRAIHLKGSGKVNAVLDPGYTDPLTKKKVLMTLGPNSTPVVAFYGSTTPAFTMEMRLVKNKLTLYPDQKYVHDKIMLVLTKP